MVKHKGAFFAVIEIELVWFVKRRSSSFKKTFPSELLNSSITFSCCSRAIYRINTVDPETSKKCLFLQRNFFLKRKSSVLIFSSIHQGDEVFEEDAKVWWASWLSRLKGLRSQKQTFILTKKPPIGKTTTSTTKSILPCISVLFPYSEKRKKRCVQKSSEILSEPGKKKFVKKMLLCGFRAITRGCLLDGLCSSSFKWWRTSVGLTPQRPPLWGPWPRAAPGPPPAPSSPRGRATRRERPPGRVVRPGTRSSRSGLRPSRKGWGSEGSARTEVREAV